MSDKFGNRFEGRWTVFNLARVLAETADSIWLEPWDESGQGIEFALRSKQGGAYHQVKRQVSGAVQWTVDRLANEGVLSSAKAHLSDPASSFVFVSSSPSALHDVAERAKTSDSYEALVRQHNRTTRQVLDDLQRLWAPWTEEQVYEGLRRLDALIIHEALLIDMDRGHLAALVTGDADTAIDILAAYALDHLTQDIRAEALWAHLEERGRHPRDWWRNESVVQRFTEQRQRLLIETRRGLIAGTVMSRDVTDELETVLISDPEPLVVVVGDAGTGKSVVLGEVIEHAVAADIAVLPFRADRLLTAASAPQTAREIGETLGLPASPSSVLANLARGRRGLLVVDQLDAVSLLSARNPAAFEAIDEAIREALTYSNISVLVACRRYDFENDPRLGALRSQRGARVVDVGQLTPEQVASVLTASGINATSLNERQLDLLRNSLNLRLLLEGGGDPGAWFRTRKDLFDRYWQEKRRRTSERLERDAAWTDVVGRMTEEIDRRRSLSVPFTILDRWERDANAMVSEGVLVRDGAFVAFGHQAFFDYAFARRFVISGQDVLAFVIGGGQQLFQRAQVREILVHLRDLDHPRFLRMVGELLARRDVRFHLKDATLALLSNLDDPTKEEWHLVREGITDWDDAVAARLRATVASRAEWFDLALDDGWLAAGLSSGDSLAADTFVTIMGRAQRVRPAAVADLLSPYIGAGGDWPNRLAYVVRLADLTVDRRFFDLVLRAIAAGDLDNVQPFAMNGTFWDEAYPLVRAKPAWAAEFARAYLDRQMALGAPGEEQATLDAIRDPLDDEFFTKIAQDAPQAYLDALLPWVLHVADATTRPGDKKYDAFSARMPGRPFRLADALVVGVDQAMQALGATDPSGIASWRTVLISARSETANFILLRVGMAAPAEHGSLIAQLLVIEPARLEAAYGMDYHWATRQFIEVVAPSLSGELSAQLQSVIRNYNPKWERTPAGLSYHGQAQWKMLSAFPDDALTSESRRRLRELRHKFGEEPPAPPTGIVVSRIGSPIPDDAAEKLTDEQWLRALTKYDADDVRWDRPPERGGGLHELAGTLFERTVAAPRRFAALALRFPDNVPSRYFDEILRGLAETRVDVPFADIAAVCARADALPDRPSGRWIVDVIAKRAHEKLPPEAIDLTSWYATNATDPASTGRPISGEHMSTTDLIDSHALNCDRGRALLAIAELIRANPDRLEELRPAIETASSDRIDAVRAAAGEALLASLPHDRDLVSRTLRSMLADAPDALLASRWITRLISYFAQTEFEAWRDVLERMLSTGDAKVVRSGASIAALASFASPDARPLVLTALAASEQHRLGVADVAAANVGNATVSVMASEWAATLFEDPSKEVRREAATAMSSLSPDSLGDHQDLIRSFLASPAFEDNEGLFFRHLAESASVPPELELDACERYLRWARTAAGDIRTSAAGSATDVSRIAVRAHDHGDEKTRDKALDMIDDLLAVGAFGISEAIQLFER